MCDNMAVYDSDLLNDADLDTCLAKYDITLTATSEI